MMFSATFPRAVMRIADNFLDRPVMLKVGRVGGAASSVTQKIVYVDGREKTNTCIELLKAVPGKTIVFVNTKRAADTLEMDLSDLGCPAASVHGDTEQRNPRPRPRPQPPPPPPPPPQPHPHPHQATRISASASARSTRSRRARSR